MKINFNKAFTLIELLVVITIIWILATWAVTVYTSQIQKWRDATRISSLESLRGWIEQYYQDDSEYPEKTAFSWIKVYVPVLPKDPKTHQANKNTSLEYAYNVWEDDNGIANQIYEVSCWFENSGNNDNKAAKDWGNDPYRLEVWIVIKDWDTAINTSIKWALKEESFASWVESWNPICVTSWSWWTNSTMWNCYNDILVIK